MIQYTIYNLQSYHNYTTNFYLKPTKFSSIEHDSFFILQFYQRRNSKRVRYIRRTYSFTFPLHNSHSQRFSNKSASTLRTRRVSLAAILTQRRRHGLAETSFRAVRWRGGCFLCEWGLRGIGQRCPGQSGQSWKYSTFRFALEISASGHGSVVFAWGIHSVLLIFIEDAISSSSRIREGRLTDRFVKDHSSPVSRCKLSFADIGDGAWFRATNPYSISDNKAVRVLGKDHAVICSGRNYKCLMASFEFCASFDGIFFTEFLF